MDLGIEGKWALVCAASKGLGKGCAKALAHEGVNVVITARGVDALEATAAELRALNPTCEVRAVAGDITTPEGRAAALAACPQVDILVNNAGGPPPGDFRRLGPRRLDQGGGRQHADADRAHQGRRRRHGRAGLRAHRQHHVGGGEGADRHPRPVQRRAQRLDGLRGRARPPAGAGQPQRDDQWLLPGPFDTDRLRSTMVGAAKKTGKPIEELLDARRQLNPTRRFGQADEFGALCAFVCSVHAGYLTGQNLLVDGGAYPGTF